MQKKKANCYYLIIEKARDTGWNIKEEDHSLRVEEWGQWIRISGISGEVAWRR